MLSQSKLMVIRAGFLEEAGAKTRGRWSEERNAFRGSYQARSCSSSCKGSRWAALLEPGCRGGDPGGPNLGQAPFWPIALPHTPSLRVPLEDQQWAQGGVPSPGPEQDPEPAVAVPRSQRGATPPPPPWAPL